MTSDIVRFSLLVHEANDSAVRHTLLPFILSIGENIVAALTVNALRCTQSLISNNGHNNKHEITIYGNYVMEDR